MGSKAESVYAVGLDGIAAARTRLSRIDGEKGELIIAGFPVEELAPNAVFEETFFLLLHDRIPTNPELLEFKNTLSSLRTLPKSVEPLLQSAASHGSSITDMLRMASASLSIGMETEDPVFTGMRAVAAFPTAVASAYRALKNLPNIPPDPGLSHAANFLWMLSGSLASPVQIRALDTYWNTVADHGLNPSTFAARVIASTRSDLISAITGALGALKGPLHGGAPGPALDMVFEIGTEERAEEVIQAKLAAKERLMGFGHRLYRVRDPRADVLADQAKLLYETTPELRRLHDLAMHVEKTALRLLSAAHPDRPLKTNVEFYAALLLHGIGLDRDLFTPTFACARAAGWTAHAIEQSKERILRPDAEYIGATGRRWKN